MIYNNMTISYLIIIILFYIIGMLYKIRFGIHLYYMYKKDIKGNIKMKEKTFKTVYTIILLFVSILWGPLYLLKAIFNIFLYLTNFKVKK